jgi:hypothetical protein
MALVPSVLRVPPAQISVPEPIALLFPKASVEPASVVPPL